jgi:hypothetical protein
MAFGLTVTKRIQKIYKKVHATNKSLFLSSRKIKQHNRDLAATGGSHSLPKQQ